MTIFSYQSAFPGGVIGSVTALDNDPYDTLRYRVGNNQNLKNMNYFAMDEIEGTLRVTNPLDEGIYHVNVSVSDGKFVRSADAVVSVRILSQEMVDNSFVLVVGPVTADEFLARYKSLLVRAIAGELLEDQKRIHVLSFQKSNDSKSIRRKKHEDGYMIDILLVIERKNGEFYSRKEAISSFQARKNRIRRKVSLKYFEVMKTFCKSSDQCNAQGECIDEIFMKKEVSKPLSAKLMSIVAPSFEHRQVCICYQGYDGELCQKLANACGYKPCSENHICVPTNSTAKGYLCNCPEGFVGQRCEIDVRDCKTISCYYPRQPLSFIGKSYAQYSSVRQSEASSLQLSFYIKTRHPVGTIYHTEGVVDYSYLEVINGFVQFRWDCGSGEGVVRVTNQKVSNNKWHLINLTREGTVAVLSVDGVKSSGISPGENDVLNIDFNHIIFGAKISPNNDGNVIEGFVGCLDQITFDNRALSFVVKNSELSSTISLKRLMNVDYICPDSLPLPGLCSSHPCKNGGTCLELSKTKFKCTCLVRFTGPQCEIDNDPCYASPCLNEGKCVVLGHNFTCHCPEPLSGKRCEYGKHCSPNPCLNGGLCEEGSKGPICKCRHFSGDRCAEDLDECAGSPCQNGGTCRNFFGGFSCQCPVGFSGQYCSTAVDSNSESQFSISTQEFVIMVAFIVSFLIILATIAAFQKTRWTMKREQQNNRAIQQAPQYKNDLRSASDSLKRNSKLCNIEAEVIKYLYYIYLYFLMLICNFVYLLISHEEFFFIL